MEYEWKDVVDFLLAHTVSFVDSELLGGDQEMKEFDLMLRITGKMEVWMGRAQSELRTHTRNLQGTGMGSMNSKTIWRTS